MAMGPNVIDCTHAVYSNLTGGTYGNVYYFNTGVEFNAVTFIVHYTRSSCGQVKGVIYRQSDQVKIAETAVTSGISVTAGQELELTFATPPVLAANTNYIIGIYVASTSTVGGKLGFHQGEHNHASSPAFTTAYCTDGGGARFISNTDAFPNSSTTNFQLNLKLSVAPVNVPATASNLAPNTFKDNRTAAARFSWTYTDTESDVQYRYEIGYRLRDSTGAWTETTQVSSNAYHDFATGTFTLGEEYDWRLRVDDGINGWSPYYTASFTSGTSAWVYGAITPSSGADLGTNILAAHGDFEAANAIALGGWESNPIFGEFPQSTVARTTTKPDTGSYSLEVTLPTLSSVQHTIANCRADGLLVVGRSYRLTGRVWMQTGGPDFRCDMVFQADQIAPISTVKNAWTTVTSVFTCTQTGGIFPAIKTEGAATAGQKMYVDNMKIHEVASTSSAALTVPEMANYYIQVRTADAVGWSPWSTSLLVSFGMVIKVKIAGAWVAVTKKIKVAGSWVTPTNKNKSGGTWS